MTDGSARKAAARADVIDVRGVFENVDVAPIRQRTGFRLSAQIGKIGAVKNQAFAGIGLDINGGGVVTLCGQTISQVAVIVRVRNAITDGAARNQNLLPARNGEVIGDGDAGQGGIDVRRREPGKSKNRQLQVECPVAGRCVGGRAAIGSSGDAAESGVDDRLVLRVAVKTGHAQRTADVTHRGGGVVLHAREIVLHLERV